MFDIITAVSTNLFRTFIIRKFMSIFFPALVENKRKEKALYFLFYLITTGIYLAFHFPPMTMAVNIFMIYMIAQVYEGEQKKKILVSLLIYGINMICDILSVYSFSNYIVGKEYVIIAVYVTVLLFGICEFIVERYVIKKRERKFTPPYWNILVLIPIISMAILFILVMNNLGSQLILVSVSAGILFINILIFYLYNALIDIYIKLEENALYERQVESYANQLDVLMQSEENALYERQVESYANQLDVLMQSEERISALRHDMKHHLNELIIMAKRKEGGNRGIADYIQNMQMFMENDREYSCSGNKEMDSILNYMLNKAQEVLDEVKYKISIPKEMNVRPFDLNIILGNLLENAILAASNSKDKKLSVFVKFEKEMLFINVWNTYEDNLIKVGNNYLTTKKEMGKHGLGLKNVKKAVSSYHGNIEISDADNIFDVKIMLYSLLVK